MIQPEAVKADFRRLLLMSSGIAGLVIVAQLAAALVFFWGDGLPSLVFLAAVLALVSMFGGIICVVLFIANLLAYRLKGFWFAVPVIVAWALPLTGGLLISNIVI